MIELAGEIFAKLSTKGVERAIIRLLQALTPEMLMEAIKRDITLLQAIKNFPEKYKKEVYAILGMIKTLGQIYPRPDLDDAIQKLMQRMKEEKLDWMIRIFETKKGRKWFRKQILELINFVWG